MTRPKSELLKYKEKLRHKDYTFELLKPNLLLFKVMTKSYIFSSLKQMVFSENREQKQTHKMTTGYDQFTRL